MPAFCAVFGCSNRHDREKDKSYYRLPKVITHQGERTRQLSEKRRAKWLINIGRSDLKPASYDNIRVCSDHFIDKPAALYDHLHPDWTPTVQMGHKREAPTPDRYKRQQTRATKKRKTEAAVALCSLQDSDMTETIVETEMGVTVQTDINMPLMSAIQSELSRLQQENAQLKISVDQNQFKFSFFEGNDNRVKYYTGLPNVAILQSLFEYVKPDIIHNANSALCKFQQLILVLMKLRLNSSNQDLGVRFAVSDTTVSRTFQNVLEVLAKCLKPIIYWPEREELRKTMPMSFRAQFGTKVAVIMDCFEIPMERPSNLVRRGECWSNYKHSHTAKYLIGITPQGVISFISDSYGGRASDKNITEICGFLNKLLPGDIVLADRGFDTQDTVGTMCAQVYIPAFTKGKSQLGALDIERTRKIANSRIHVERVIGLVRQKYCILSERLPHDYFQKSGTDDSLTVDKIVLVCCSLTNLCDSVVPFD